MTGTQPYEHLGILENPDWTGKDSETQQQRGTYYMLLHTPSPFRLELVDIWGPFLPYEPPPHGSYSSFRFSFRNGR